MRDKQLYFSAFTSELQRLAEPSDAAHSSDSREAYRHPTAAWYDVLLGSFHREQGYFDGK